MFLTPDAPERVRHCDGETLLDAPVQKDLSQSASFSNRSSGSPDLLSPSGQSVSPEGPPRPSSPVLPPIPSSPLQTSVDGEGSSDSCDLGKYDEGGSPDAKELRSQLLHSRVLGAIVAAVLLYHLSTQRSEVTEWLPSFVARPLRAMGSFWVLHWEESWFPTKFENFTGLPLNLTSVSTCAGWAIAAWASGGTPLPVADCVRKWWSSQAAGTRRSFASPGRRQFCFPNISNVTSVSLSPSVRRKLSPQSILSNLRRSPMWPREKPTFHSYVHHPDLAGGGFAHGRHAFPIDRAYRPPPAAVIPAAYGGSYHFDHDDGLRLVSY